MSVPYKSLYKYFDLDRVTQKNGKRYYVCPEGNKLSSVTTILSATKDMTGLDEWRKRIGNEKADKEVKDSTNIGTLVHTHLENFLRGEPRPAGSNYIRQLTKKMSDVIIERGLYRVDELWGIEEQLYYPELYAGTADILGVYDGRPAIMDFKTTKKPKKKEWIEDYYIQGVAYAMAHNYHFGTDIKDIVLFMVSRDNEYQEWHLSGDEYEFYQDKWINRLDMFYS